MTSRVATLPLLRNQKVHKVRRKYTRNHLIMAALAGAGFVFVGMLAIAN